MVSSQASEASQRIRAITHGSLIVNLGLCALKVVTGLWSGSMALLADGIHSLSDMGTDVAVLLGHWLGSKAPDRKHPYGHGRLETFSAGFIALILIVVGGGMVWAAALAIAREEVIAARPVILFVALVSVMVKECLYRKTAKVARQTNSSALYANAWHQRSDALSSVAVVFGYLALRFGFPYGDSLAALGVGFMVILVGTRILGQCLEELTESAVDQNTIALIEGAIESDAAIYDWHKLRTRSVGREIFLDLHILVDPELNVKRAHDISEDLESAIAERLSRPVNIMIHIEPDVPEQRGRETGNWG